MARSVNNTVLDAALAYVADNGVRLDVCATEPLTYAEATTTGDGSGAANSLATYTLTAGDGNGDYTIADGDTSGRKLTVAAQTGATIDQTGTADHLAITDNVSELIYVTTITSQGITSGGTVDTSAWDIEIADPTA